jgi:hypothetical protein
MVERWIERGKVLDRLEVKFDNALVISSETAAWRKGVRLRICRCGPKGGLEGGIRGDDCSLAGRAAPAFTTPILALIISDTAEAQASRRGQIDGSVALCGSNVPDGSCTGTILITVIRRFPASAVAWQMEADRMARMAS